MVIIKIPTTHEFWMWLMRFCYRRVAKPLESPPHGVPGMRDPEMPCTAFAPRPALSTDWGNCESDGHYLCKECAHFDPGEDEQ